MTNDNTTVGTFMLDIVDVVGGMAVTIQTDQVQYVGNYTITVDVVMQEYPENTA